MNGATQASGMRRGFLVFLALMVIEIVEYLVGASMSVGSLPIMVLLMVPGAGLIIWYFMHIRRLWRPEE
jgi:hypothetical protein